MKRHTPGSLKPDVNNTNKAMAVYETVITNKESNCGAGYWPQTTIKIIKIKQQFYC